MGISLDPQTAATALGVILLAVGALMSAPSLVTSVGTWLQEDGELDPLEPLESEPALNPIQKYVGEVLAVCEGTPPDVVLAYLVAGTNVQDVMRLELKRLRST